MTRFRAVVTGAGGFIGHHLVRRLKADGYWVRGIDLKYPEFEPSQADEFLLLDLRRWAHCARALRGVGGARTNGEHRVELYHLAANTGGIGFIERHKAAITHDNTLIDTHVIEAARAAGVARMFYASSACVYPAARQRDPRVVPLREEDAYPADPEDGYGWEKLFAERQCQHYRAEYGLATYVARFHNIYGPLGTFDGGREKSPAALCRKIAQAPDGGEIDVWGDGQQTRSYCYVDDCVDGILRLAHSAHHAPLNIGQERCVSIDGLVDIIASAAGKRISTRHVDGPTGVRGRTSDNARVRAVLDWEPRTPLEDGIRRTYIWISHQVARGLRAESGAIDERAGAVTS